MAASVLNSPAAVAASVLVVRAFIRMRQALVVHAELAARLSDLERTVGDHDDANVGLIETLRAMMEPPPERPRERIGFRQTDG